MSAGKRRKRDGEGRAPAVSFVDQIAAMPAYEPLLYEDGSQIVIADVALVHGLEGAIEKDPGEFEAHRGPLEA
jgi:hypothetical protein